MRLMDQEPCERFANEGKIMDSGQPKIMNTLCYKILVKKKKKYYVIQKRKILKLNTETICKRFEEKERLVFTIYHSINNHRAYCYQ